MYNDHQGNPLPEANSQSSELYQQALQAFNIYRGDPIGLLNQALKITPHFVMAHLLKAWLLTLTTEPGANQAASEFVRTAAALPMTAQEASHLASLEQLLLGEWDKAAIHLDVHNALYPRDLVALQCGHVLDFYRGNNRNLHDRIARTLPHWSTQTPGYAIVLGMYAFGLEECGQYSLAESYGRQALELEPHDCWAHHAVTHVMEMQGRPEDGIGWMQVRQPYWDGEDNFFRVHNWWHLALYYLDLEQFDQALALYDGPIRKECSTSALDMVDASSLLWRLSANGHDVGNRWQELSTKWQQHADGESYPFNDWHAAMAYLGAGDTDKLAQLIAQIQLCQHAGNIQDWSERVGSPLILGFQAFWQQDYAHAAKVLFKTRYIDNCFGGSHAQRDVIDWTLAEALIRSGQKPIALAIAQERLALNPHSRHNLRLLARAKSLPG